MAYQPKSYKKFVATAATATLVASAVVPVAFAAKPATEFSDVAPQYKDAVDYLVDNTIAAGKTPSTFGTAENIIRVDAAIWIAKATLTEGEISAAPASEFTDVPDRGVIYVDALKSKGYVNGTDATTYNSYANISRGEVAMILAEAYDITGNTADNKFTDVNSRYLAAVSALKDNGITSGKTSTRFGTNDAITRGELAIWVYKLETLGALTVSNLDVAVDGSKATVTADVKNAEENADATVSVYPNGNLSATPIVNSTKVVGGKVTTAFNDVPAGTHTVVVKVGEVEASKSFVIAAAATPKVESVMAINGTTLEVKFNQAIDKNTIAIGDFVVAPLDGQDLTTSSLVGSLSADGKTYTISTAGAEFFEDRYDVTLTDSSVKSVAGKDVEEYTTTINVSDTTAPILTGTSFVPAGTGEVNVTVKLNERVSSLGTVSVDGAVVDAEIAPDGKSFVLTGLEAGKTYKVDVIGAIDIAGNVANPLTINAATTADTTAPTGIVTVSASTIKIDFNEEVSNFDVFVNNGEYLTAEQDGNDPTVYTVDASSALGSNTFLNNAQIKVINIYDLAGNKGQDITKTANLTKDTVAPKFVSASVDGSKLVLKYDEVIAASDINQDDLSIKYVNKDGVLITLTPGTDFTATSSLGSDLNGNGFKDAGTEELKYVEVTLAEVGAAGVTTGKDFIVDGKLVDGTYTVNLAKDQLRDAAGNLVAASTFTVVPSASNTAKTVTFSASSLTADLDNNEFKVLYSEDMSNSALVASNYKLAGVALPSGTTLTFVDNKQTVLVTLPVGYIKATGSRILAVSNVTAVDGDTQKTQDQVTVTLNENVAPVASKVTIESDTKATVDFTEAVLGDTTGIVVKLNGVTVTPDLSTNTGDLVLTFAATTLKATDKITVTFTDSDLSDESGNAVKNGSIAN